MLGCRLAPLVDPSSPKGSKTLLSKSFFVRYLLLYTEDRSKINFHYPPYTTKATLTSGFDAMFCFTVGVEGFERRSRRRATFENKHILALQPHIKESPACHRFERQAERSEANFVRVVRKIYFHATQSTKKRRIKNPSLSLVNLWELRDSNPRPSACKADALNQLS